MGCGSISTDVKRDGIVKLTEYSPGQRTVHNASASPSRSVRSRDDVTGAVIAIRSPRARSAVTGAVMAMEPAAVLLPKM